MLTVTTDAQGEAQFDVQPTVGGDYEIEVSALGAVNSKTVNVSPNALNLNSSITEIPVNTAQTITLNWTADGVPQSGKTYMLALHVVLSL